MRVNARGALLAMAVALLPSCLHYERQTILLRRDAAADTLSVRLIYEGVYSGSESASDIAEDLVALGKLAAAPTIFSMLDPIIQMDLKRKWASIEIEQILPVLLQLVKEVSTILGGSVTIGTVAGGAAGAFRSEERRVGKECRL